MPPLRGAVPLAESDYAPIAEPENLHLDVPGAGDVTSSKMAGLPKNRSAGSGCLEA